MSQLVSHASFHFDGRRSMSDMPEGDANNAEHRWCKKKIEEGDGLPDIATTHDVDQALNAAGFDVLETEDLALYLNPDDIPWCDEPVTAQAA